MSVSERSLNNEAERESPHDKDCGYVELANAIIARAELGDPFTADVSQIPRIVGRSIMIGPFEVRPGMRQEVPIGRAYQPVPEDSISRLAGFVGRDEYGIYIREVPDKPERGLRPSKAGIWVKQPNENAFRRLQAGQPERLSPQTDVRIGGNGRTGTSAYRIYVI